MCELYDVCSAKKKKNCSEELKSNIYPICFAPYLSWREYYGLKESV